MDAEPKRKRVTFFFFTEPPKGMKISTSQEEASPTVTLHKRTRVSVSPVYI